MATQTSQPENHQAEEAVIGAALIDPEAIWQVRQILRPGDFADKRLGNVYDAMVAISDRGDPLDFLTLTSELEARRQLKQIGGDPFISGLLNVVPSAVSVMAYAELVSDSARRRGLLGIASEIGRRAYNQQEGVDKTLSWMAAQAQSHSRGGEIKPIAGVTDAVYSEMEQYTANPLKPDQVRGLSTGWRDVDGKLGGWRTGLYVILGEPHVGKSWFALEAAARVAEQGKRVLLFSLEMTATQLVRRLCLAFARVSQRDYDLGRMDAVQVNRFDNKLGEMCNWSLDIVDDLDTASGIFATLHRESRSQNPPVMAVIDYLGLIQTETTAESVNYELSALLRGLKKLADQCNVTLLTPHQISDKAIETRADKRPKKSDGYGSGGISQHADVILGLYRDDLHNENSENPNVMEVIKLKDRLSGGADPYRSVQLYFAPTGGLEDVRL